MFPLVHKRERFGVRLESEYVSYVHSICLDETWRCGGEANGHTGLWAFVSLALASFSSYSDVVVVLFDHIHEDDGREQRFLPVRSSEPSYVRPLG